MATAVRLTEVAVAAVGGFGHAVQARLLADGATALDPDQPEPGTSTAMALVSWRPEPARAERFGSLAHKRGISWLPVVLEHPFLIAGPWITPGGPCHDCYTFRRRQHDPKARYRTDLLTAYRDDDTLGVYGHLPHHVRIAEALTRLMLRSPQPGMAAMVDLSTMAVNRVDLTGRHGCPRCGTSDTWGDPRLPALIAEITAEGALP